MTPATVRDKAVKGRIIGGFFTNTSTDPRPTRRPG
jgi:ribosomal protein S2